MHNNNMLLFEKYARQYLKSNIRLLEIGPGIIPSLIQEKMGNETIEWRTLDIVSTENLDYLAEDEYRFPVPDSSFDVVFSNQVIEHVKKIWVWMSEVSRVCKPGGHVITINPVNWPYHIDPVDCWRIYPEGMKALYDDAGLEVILSIRERLDFSKRAAFRRLFSKTKKAFIHPRTFILNFLEGKTEMYDEYAEDVITIGRKIGKE
ncbi:methyltransferase domain-containing protein [Candidatus Auribacterota bacterium]